MRLSALLWALPDLQTLLLCSPKGGNQSDAGLWVWMGASGPPASPWPGPWTPRCSRMACLGVMGYVSLPPDPGQTVAASWHAHVHVHTRAFPSARRGCTKERGAWLPRTIPPSSMARGDQLVCDTRVFWPPGEPPTLPVLSSII